MVMKMTKKMMMMLMKKKVIIKEHTCRKLYPRHNANIKVK